MKCPVCGEIATRVIDSRNIKDSSEIRRRRQCDECSHRFTTYERAEGVFPVVVKKDGRREPWSREKIARGLAKACEKRPVPTSEIERMIDELERAVGALGELEIPSSDIGERLVNALYDLDEVAYVRFASVYRSFEDIDALASEVNDLVRRRRDASDESGG